ncbi:MAG: FecCD family ABC transporter permease [Succinivibrionaceae bacterium]
MIKIETKEVNKTIFLAILLLISLVFSLNIGESELNLFNIIFYDNNDSYDYYIDLFFSVRFLRVILCCFVGGTLAISGLIYQSVFQNRLVSPDILAGSVGAVCGIVLGLILGFNSYFIPLVSLSFSVIVIAISVFIAGLFRSQYNYIIMLIVIGILLTSFLSSILSFLSFLIPDNSLYRGISYFLKGGFSNIEINDLYIFLIFGFIPSVILYIFRFLLQYLAISYDLLKIQGFPIKLVICFFLVLSTLINSTTVVICGVIPWVSIIIPNLIHLIYNSSDKYLIIPCFIMGALFLNICDTFSRIFIVECPVGVLVGFLGIPFFILILFTQYSKRKYVVK